MRRCDRLTSLFDRFGLSIQQAPPCAASLIITAGPDGLPLSLHFRPTSAGFDLALGPILFSALVDWGGIANPLIAALPVTLSYNLDQDTEGKLLITLLQGELTARRCGASTIVNRLGEVLIVRMLRAQIEAGATECGLLADLADPRLRNRVRAAGGSCRSSPEPRYRRDP
jgi:hypothetical protein